MITLKKLKFQNYKTYYGIQEIDFENSVQSENQKKNILLIGGLNGAGKTTILKAVYYALFGNRGMKKEEFTRIFSNTINNLFFDEGGRESSIRLAIQIREDFELEIVVKWIFDGSKKLVNEQREISTRNPKHTGGVNTRKINNIEAFYNYMDRFIPFDAAPFFIFDGEELKDLVFKQANADSNSKNDEMKNAIHKITGIKAYKDLTSDLYASKLSTEREINKSYSKDIISDHREEIKKITEELEKSQEQLQKINNDLRNNEELFNTIREQRDKKMLTNSKSREVLVARRGALEAEAKEVDVQTKNFFINNVFLLKISPFVGTLQKRIQLEKQEKLKKLRLEAQLQPYHSFISEILKAEIDPPLLENQKEQLYTSSQKVWMNQQKITNTIDENILVRHDLTDNQYTYLQSLKSPDRAVFNQLVKRKEKIDEQLNEIEQEIRNAPEQVDVSKENESIDRLGEQIGQSKYRSNVLKRKIDKLKNSLLTLKNKSTRKTNNTNDTQKLEKRLNMLDKLHQLMQTYTNELTTIKTNKIKEEFSFMLNKLIRKQDEFGKIEFDTNSYRIRLYNDRMSEISLLERSAGEMQIISSSLIWALTRASGFQLPMVIDTPLGRLDSVHRTRLIEEYYKYLSHQVVILSTDTEVSSEYEQLMLEHTYKNYMLDYNEEKKYTQIKEGYFEFTRGI